MTPIAAGILGYFLGLASAAFIVAVVLLVHGGRDVRDHELRERGHRAQP